MPYLQVSDFRLGMVRTRKRVTGVPGSLWLGKNVHITRGGDIERRKKFVPEYNVTGTFGVAALRSQLWVFGSVAAGSVVVPINVQYQRLQHPSAGVMTKLLDVKTFGGKFYAVAEYDDGNVYHYYNGSRVTDWDTISAANADYTLLADLFVSKLAADPTVTAKSVGNAVVITAVTPGTPFTISTSTTNGGGVNDQTAVVTHAVANVAAVAEVQSSATITVNGGTNSPGVNQIASVTANAVEILGTPVDWSGSNESTAVRTANQINSGFATHGYSASALGATVTVKAAVGTGATSNGNGFIVTPAGNVSLTTAPLFAGGVTAVAAVAQVEIVTFGGTFEVADLFTLTVNGTAFKATGMASGMGRTLYVDKNRVFSPVGSLVRYCKLNDATTWNPATAGSDAGFLNIALVNDGNEKVLTAARYQTQAAFISADNITLYVLDPDPTKFVFQQTLEHTGTRAPKSVIRYGNNDVLYLDLTGVRSLRARDASNAPFVSDIGNAIDTYVQGLVKALTTQQVLDAQAAIEPLDGRYMLMLGNDMIVLSAFAGSKISAWTTYEVTEFGGAPVQMFARTDTRLVVRAGNSLYVYGGLAGDVMPGDDEVIAEVDMGFLGANTPATIKFITGFDIALTNTWSCEIGFDPNDPDKTINCGNLSKITYASQDRVEIPGESSMVAPILTCSKGGDASISMLAIHYEAEDDPG